MTQACRLIMLFIMLAITAVSAIGIPDTTLELTIKDLSTNARLASLPVLVKLTNIRTGTEEKNNEYIDNAGKLVYRLEPGSWRMALEIFDPKTEGVQYYGQRVMYVQENEPVLNRSFYLTPVGSLEGVVMHEDGRLAGQALLDFRCSFGGQFDYPVRTNQFGSFKLAIAPAGACRIIASTRDRVGTAEVNLTKGQAHTAKIVLDQTAASLRLSTSVAWLIAGTSTLVILLVGYFLLHKHLRSELKDELAPKAHFARKILRKIRRVRGAEKTENQDKEVLNPRARDIIQTLNEREKKSVEFLFAQKGNQATQAQLRNSTGIPKTSLVRVFQSLEHKKVITVEKIGKMKKVTLTAWFMGKE